MHGLQFDVLDAHRRWFGFDDERDDEVLFPIARRHRRPLRHQQLLGAKRVLRGPVLGRGRDSHGRGIGLHGW